MTVLSLGTSVADCPRLRRPSGRAAGTPPALAAPPALAGTGEVGAALVADPGVWTGSPAPRVTLAWQREKADIGAAGPVYRPGPEDAGARLRVRAVAVNAHGRAEAVSSEIFILFSPPITTGGLADRVLPLNSGVHALDASSVFTGSSLTFGVTGEGVSIDPDTGLLSIFTDSLHQGVTVTVTATNPAGSVETRFKLTVAALEDAPVMATAPALHGEGRIGTEVTVDPGLWNGTPAPEIALQWLIDDMEIAGATAPVYVPGPDDDERSLACRVTASNAAGTAEALAGPLLVAHLPPVAQGALADLVLALGTGAVVDAGAVFAGEALVFAVEGPGATIDPATGLVTLAADELVEDAAVTVTARNSGGEAASTFRLSVVEEAPEAVPPAVVVGPALLDEPRIGGAVTVDPGVWSGTPAPGIALQWLIDGTEIDGATGDTYAPVPQDDLRTLACRVVAENVAGAAQAETEAATVTHAPPLAAQALADLVLAQDSGPQTVDAAADFTGAALVFSVTGEGASIDPATGVVTLATGTAGTETITVTATNSGGAASSAFKVTVTGPLAAPEAVGTIADAVFEQDSGVRTVSAQAGFRGEHLVYLLESAPAGVTINAGSGLVAVPTDALLDAAEIVVRALNAAGSATQAFAVTVRSTATAFDAAAKLGELRFINEAGEPASWSLRDGFGRLVTDPAGRNHGDWTKARGDGLYRSLVRFNHGNTGLDGLRPFSFGARLKKVGSDFSGLRIEVHQESGSTPNRSLLIRKYHGRGTGADTIGAFDHAGWDWNTWYWIDMEIDGASVRARIYPEAATPPEWQADAETDYLEPGAFGPGAFPRNGQSTTLDIRRLEYHPLGQAAIDAPPAAEDGDWDIDQITVQA